MKVLTEPQRTAVSEVSRQLKIQAEAARQASEGSKAARGLLGEDVLGVPQRAPNVLNRTVMAVNRTLDFLSGKVSDQSLAALDKAMRSGSDLNAVLNSLPAKDVVPALRAINQMADELSPSKIRNIGLLGTLSEEAAQLDEPVFFSQPQNNQAPADQRPVSANIPQKELDTVIKIARDMQRDDPTLNVDYVVNAYINSSEEKKKTFAHLRVSL
jgi:hypothetical protein